MKYIFKIKFFHICTLRTLCCPLYLLSTALYLLVKNVFRNYPTPSSVFTIFSADVFLLWSILGLKYLGFHTFLPICATNLNSLQSVRLFYWAIFHFADASLASAVWWRFCIWRLAVWHLQGGYLPICFGTPPYRMTFWITLTFLHILFTQTRLPDYPFKGIRDLRELFYFKYFNLWFMSSNQTHIFISFLWVYYFILSFTI
jgi:hypothetical protein